MFGRITVILVLLLLINFLGYLDPEGGIDVLIPVVLAAVLLEYLRRTLEKWTLVLDRTANLVSLEVKIWTGRDERVWKLSEIASVEVNSHVSSSRPRKFSWRPALVLKNGQRVPLRSFDRVPDPTSVVVLEIRKFLGQGPGCLDMTKLVD
ncbi:MAG: hypothetical protein ACR2OY_05515 [Boseongicola sp.]